METEAHSLSELPADVDTSENDVKTLAAGASITLVGKVGGRAVDAVTDVILARILGPASFGLYSIGITLLRIVGTIGMLGMQNGVIRFGTRFDRTSKADLKSTLIFAIGFSVLSGSLLGILLFALAPWMANSVYHKPELVQVFRGFAFGFPLAIGMWVSSAATRISKNMKYSVLSEDIIQPVSNLILLVLFSLIGFTLFRAIVSNVISFGIGFGLALFFVAILFSEAISLPRGENISLTKLIKFSVPTGLAGTFTLLTDWTGRLFVGIFRTAYEAGVYQSASQISIIFVVILNALNTIFSPMIADLYNRKEMARVEELYRVSTKWGLYLVSPLYLVLLIFPRELITAIFGASYVSGYVPMLILSTAQIINIGTGAVGLLLIMTGHQNNWFVTSGITMTLCIVLNSILVPNFGMVGAAVATGLAITSLYIAGLAQVKIILRIWPYDLRYLKGLFSLMITGGILVLMKLLLNFTPLSILVISLLISYAAFSGLLLLLGLDDEDREFVDLLMTRLKINKGA